MTTKATETAKMISQDLKFVDAADISGARVTKDGYLVGEARCARTGVQMYRADEIGLEGTGMVGVYRPPETVFARDSLASYAGKPITLLHPSEMVDADNWKQLAVGDIGTDIARDGETVKVPYKIMDSAAIAAIKDGVRQLSMGYTCNLEMKDGVAPDGTPYQAIQTGPLRINHMALVPAARAGSDFRIGDSAPADLWGATPLTVRMDDNQRSPGMAGTLQKVVFDGMTIETTDQGAEAIAKLQAKLDASAKKLTDAATASEKAIAAKDAKIDDLTKKLADAKAKELTPEAVSKLVADRAALESVAGSIAPGVKPVGLSDADLRRAVVAEKFGDAAIKDKSAAYIDARFDILAEDAKAADGQTTDQVRKVVGGGLKDNSPGDLGKVYDSYAADLSNAWKHDSKKDA